MKAIFSLFLLIISLTVPAQSLLKNNKAFKYAAMKREQIPDSVKWKIENIFSSNEDWEYSQTVLRNQIQIIPEKSSNWISSSNRFYEFLKFYEDIHKLNTQLYNYALLQSGIDFNNQVFANMLSEMEQIQVEIDTKLSFMNYDILRLGGKKIEQYIKENDALKDFAFMLTSILNQKDHILSPEIQKIVSIKSINDDLPGKISLLLNSSEIPRNEVTLSDKQNIPLNYNNYLHYRSSVSSKDRTNVMRSFGKIRRNLKNLQHCS